MNIKSVCFESYIQKNFEKFSNRKFCTFKFSNLNDLINAVFMLAKLFDFMRGRFKCNEEIFFFLIEAWEHSCIEELVYKENGDWDDKGYLNGIVIDEHNKIVELLLAQTKGTVLVNKLINDHN